MRGAVVSLVALGGRLGAQPVRRLDGTPHPRVAVVLSGGSAKGLADIGALDVIEKMGIPIDAVAGTSMGSVIGGLYAAGYSPAAIQSLLTTEDWSTFFKRPDDRRLQGGTSGSTINGSRSLFRSNARGRSSPRPSFPGNRSPRISSVACGPLAR